MTELLTIKGKITHYIYHNENNRFTVARFELYQLDEKEITITGYLPKLPKEVFFVLQGDYVEHHKYGMQFQVIRFEKDIPSERDTVISYLSGPTFPGIGRKYAEVIIEQLGADALKKIKEDPEVLDLLPKMTEKRKESLLSGLLEQDDFQNSIEFFSLHGLGIRTIMKIDAIYGKDAYKLVSENPYRLVYDVDGIGFKTADKLAMTLGFSLEHPYRLEAALVALVSEMMMQSGDSYVLLDNLERKFASSLSGIDYLFTTVFESVIGKGQLFLEADRVYHYSQYNAESIIAEYLNIFPFEKLPSLAEKELDNFLPLIQENFRINYSDKQIEAIRTFFAQEAMILTGGPGTGKTTVVKGIVSLFKIIYPNYSVALCAPTGRAAKRLTELTGVPSYTVHSLLKWDLETNTFGQNEKEPLTIDLLIIDEFSMVDQWLFSNLAKAGKLVKKLLLIGDEDQLPSVSPGKLLNDIIEADIFSLVRLDKIFRQKEGSDVITLAHQIREGYIDILADGEDVCFLELALPEVKNAVCRVVEEALEKGYDINDIQVLSPKYNGIVGIDALNHSLQYLCNPAQQWKKEVRMGYRVFREGDKLLQLKNQTDDNVFNGDIGILVEIEDYNPRDIVLFVDFDGNIVEYHQDRFHHLTHAYCISIHKSQGSEYPIVIIPFLQEQYFMLSRRLIYTGVSRAKKSLVLLGEKQALLAGIAKKENHIRLTTLRQRILEFGNG